MTWKDGSTRWVAQKDLKESYPIYVAEHTEQNQIHHEPAFAWWVPYVRKHQKLIISKVKSKYWLKTQKFGIRIPKTVEEALEIDQKNGDTLWRDAIDKEMMNVRPAFHIHDSDPKDLAPGYQKICCHMIFNIKLSENFRCKATKDRRHEVLFV